MKKLFYYIIFALLIISFAVMPISATDTEVATVESETAVESETRAEIGKEEASEIVEIIEVSGSKAEAIIALAEKLGITTEEAEKMINYMLEVGDKYLGETKWWVGFKATVEEDMQFWIMAAVIAVAALALLWYALSMRFKVASPVRKLDYALNSEGGIVNTLKKSCAENSQTLAKMLEMSKEMAYQTEIYEQQMLQKDEEILKRDAEILCLKEANRKERKDMLTAEAYNLRMLKLICDRTAMPLADKATIDLFYAKGIDAIRAELSEEDFAKIEQMTSMLDTVGEKNG